MTEYRYTTYLEICRADGILFQEGQEITPKTHIFLTQIRKIHILTLLSRMDSNNKKCFYQFFTRGKLGVVDLK
jgi:hypothetical protein